MVNQGGRREDDQLYSNIVSFDISVTTGAMLAVVVKVMLEEVDSKNQLFILESCLAMDDDNDNLKEEVSQIKIRMSNLRGWSII